MTRYVVNVPEYITRKKFTPGQFLAEFAEVDGGRSKIRDLVNPVRVVWVDAAECIEVDICRTAGAIFALFQRVAVASGAICRLSWTGCTIGPAGLYTLNHAIRHHAIRKGGLNIVRHWLETKRGWRTPLGSDLSALFDYLEIRPIFRGKTAKKAATAPTETPAPESSNAIHYVYNTIFSLSGDYVRICRSSAFTASSWASSKR